MNVVIQIVLILEVILCAFVIGFSFGLEHGANARKEKDKSNDLPQ